MLDPLPVNPGRTLSKTKVEGLAQKYHSIPKCHLTYYPKYVKKVKRSKKKPVNKRIKRKRVEPANIPSIKRRIGRPKKVVPIPKGIQTITTFFRSN